KERSMSVTARLAIFAVLGFLSNPSAAAETSTTCSPKSLFGSRPSTFNFRYENDHYANQDQGYSSGLRWQFGSRDVAHDDCAPGSVTLARHVLGWALPDNPDELNLIAGVEHHVYTPNDRFRTDLIVDDRPYAGWF